MDSKGPYAKQRDQRTDHHASANVHLGERAHPYVSLETHSLKKPGQLNALGDDRAIRIEDRKLGTVENGNGSKKSNFNLFGFIKSMRDTSTKNLDKPVVAPDIGAPPQNPDFDHDSEHSSGDEKLSKAFGVDLSYTRTPRVNSEQYTDSIELENPDIEKSMLTDELRTLKFCLNDDDEECRDEHRAMNKPKNPLQQNSINYNGLRRSTIHETSLNPGSVIVIKNKKEASLLSTQDSRKVHHNSSYQNHNSIYLKDLNETDMGGLSTVHEQGETQSHSRYVHQNVNYAYPAQHNMFDTEEDKNFQRNNYEAQSFYFSHYVPNIDMSLVKGVGHPNMSHGYYSRYAMDQSSDNKKQKKGKRNFWKVEDTSEFDIRPESIFKERKTTLMIRNIPNKYTKELMLETIDEYFNDAYDFFYLPIDFKNNCNVGYAFINFKDLKFIEPFYKRFNHKKWAIFNSEKICSIKYARIQGKEECERHFRDSSLMKQPVR